MKIKVKDHYFSGEFFELEEIQEGILKTLPIPKNIKNYYGDENYISHHNQKKSLFEKIYAWIQNLNSNYKYKIINKYHTNGKILDYGCGNASFLHYLENKNFQLFGFEPNTEATKHISDKIRLFKTIEDIEEQFDIITLWHVLEHIENPEEILEKLKNKLTKNGKLIIALPNYKSYDAKYYKENWAAYDVPRHLFHYSKNGAILFFKKLGFKINHLYPLPFDAFYISLLSAKYQKGILNRAFSIVIAQISNFKALKSGEYSSVIYVLSK